MGNAKISIAKALKEIGDAELRRQAHPSRSRLQDYVRGRLEGEERELLQDHIALCRSCADLVQKLAAAGESRRAELDLDSSVADAWSGPSVPAPRRTARPRLVFWPQFFNPASALAGFLLATVLSLGVWLAFRPGVPTDANAQIAFLGQVDQTRGNVQSWRVMQRVPGQIVVLVMGGALAESYDSYELEIRAAAGEGPALWQAKGLRSMKPEGTIQALLDSGRLEAGQYVAVLYGVRGSDRTPLKEYGLIVESPTDAP